MIMSTQAQRDQADSRGIGTTINQLIRYAEGGGGGGGEGGRGVGWCTSTSTFH